jgi:hypothetical protein
MDNLTSTDENLTYLPLADILIIVAGDDEQRVIA